jgi:hypothetical protein
VANDLKQLKCSKDVALSVGISILSGEVVGRTRECSYRKHMKVPDTDGLTKRERYAACPIFRRKYQLVWLCLCQWKSHNNQLGRVAARVAVDTQSLPIVRRVFVSWRRSGLIPF